MSRYLGLDFGTWMIKAAATTSCSAAPLPLVLGLAPDQAYLPFVADAETNRGASWELFRQRRCVPTIAHGFRDTVIDPSGSLPLAGSPRRHLDLLTSVLQGTRQALQQACSAAAAMVVTVPDHWQSSAWAMPVAMATGGWNPLLSVREWAAALATVESPEVDAVILLSLGAGPLRATCCTRCDNIWSPLIQKSDSKPSGSKLRQSIYRWLVEEVTRQTRRDPTETYQDDQAIHDAIEQTLLQLQTDNSTTLEVPVFGQRVTRVISRTALTEWLAPLLDPAVTLLQGVLRQAGEAGRTVRVFAWGELASLSPVQQQLCASLPNGVSLHLLEPTVVAEGAARICALAAENCLATAGPVFASVEKNSGCYVADYCPERQSAVFPLLERLPMIACRSGQMEQAWIVGHDPTLSGEEIPISSIVRIGRDPRSDWVVNEEVYPEVSRAHVAIIRDAQRFFLRDLGSSNGTYLNGRVVQGSQPLSHADVIMLGLNGPQFRFEIRKVDRS